MAQPSRLESHAAGELAGGCSEHVSGTVCVTRTSIPLVFRPAICGPIRGIFEMRSRRTSWRCAAACALVAMTTSVPNLESWAGPSRVGRQKGVERAAGSASARDAGTASIVGGAWHADNTPIAHAKLQLRNAVTGKLRATVVGTEAGQFAFEGLEGGTYIVELVSKTGTVLTTGQRIVLRSGETVVTFVRLSTKVPWFEGFFANAATVVSLAAATIGVTAVAPDQMRCASPPCR